MTKPLARPVFTKHATSLMNINSIIAGCVQNVVYNIDNITSYSMDYVGNKNMKYDDVKCKTKIILKIYIYKYIYNLVRLIET